MIGFVEEIWEEIADFFEDYSEVIFNKHRESIKSRTAVIGGVAVRVRPAYVFAERVENILKLIFGISITISAFTASFLGFASLSDLIDVLVNSLFGRTLMLIIGLSYLTVGLWKLLHLKKESK